MKGWVGSMLGEGIVGVMGAAFEPAGCMKKVSDEKHEFE